MSNENNLIYIGEYKEFCQLDYPSMKEFFEEHPYKNQDKIAEYLKKGKFLFVSTAYPHDVFTNESINMEEIGMSDGVYAWVNILAYYVEKYNLRLPKAFEEHILKHL